MDSCDLTGSEPTWNATGSTPAGATYDDNTRNGFSNSFHNHSAQQGQVFTGHRAAGSNSYMQQGHRGLVPPDAPWGSAAERGRGRSCNSQGSRTALYAAAEAGSWGSTRSDSALGGYQGGHRVGVSDRYQQHSSSCGNLRSGSPGYNSHNNRGYNRSYGSRDHTNTGGQGLGRGSRSSSQGFRTGRGLGLGGFRPGSGGQGFAAPFWVKQGCWLVRTPDSSSGPESFAAGSIGQLSASVNAASPTDGNKQAAPAAGQGKVVIIMRGLPGSGKSTRAAQIAAEAEATAAAGCASDNATAAIAAVAVDTATAAIASTCTELASSSYMGVDFPSPAVIHSTDSYFIDPATGVYSFNPELLSVNHQRNLDAFCASLAAGVSTIIVDNTNIQPWQFEKYVTTAWAAGYKVREEIVGEFSSAAAADYATRNLHGVPHDKILMMLDQWRRQ